jgi:uncharacterized protein (TIGR02996 family)
MPVPEEAAFLKAVLELPDDDGPRLVYADWLDERGDPRGEFIRVQCELARLAEDDPRRGELQAREGALLTAHRREWNQPLYQLLTETSPSISHRERREIVRRCTYRRGFVEGVAVRTAVFVTCTDPLFRLGPLRAARLWDAGPLIGDLTRVPALARLAVLDLSGNGLTNQDAQVIARCPSLTGLRRLDLRSNAIGPDGVEALRRSPFLRRLSELLVDGQPVLSNVPPARMSAAPPRTVVPLLPPPGHGQPRRRGVLPRWLRRLFE